MALAPRTETMYIAFTMTYALITGLTYAGFSAVVLEAIGLGAAATKYNVFASLSNMPIAYMTVIEGWAQTRWNVGGMLVAEALFASAGLLVFVAALLSDWHDAGRQRPDAANRAIRPAAAPRRPTFLSPATRRTLR